MDRENVSESRMPGSSLLRNPMKNEGKKRTLLVVEDSELNREILRELLQDEFSIIEAENGEEGIKRLKENREKLSLVLLDVYMPVCDGFTFLQRTQQDPYLSSVPVVVTTGSDKREDEEKCLRLGATDFITKPYNLEIMLGRIHNIIRLHESISALSIVEFDKVTGLYTMSAFLHHAGQLLSENENTYDLAILNIQDFPSVNRLYGERKGDQVLAYFAGKLQERITDALEARQGDNFYVLCPAMENGSETEIRQYFTDIEDEAPVPNLRTRLGVYRDIDKTQPVSVLCDRIKTAVISSESKSTDNVIFYDSKAEEKRLAEQKMLMSFEEAVRKKEFVIWIQPKVDILSGQIMAGEALVRWIDSDGVFHSPGDFIPLFEREGQIRELDEYIFRMVCQYQKKCLTEGRRAVPLSINLSRNSLFSPGIVERYLKIAEKEGVELSLIPIEITESAATSEQKIKGICEEFVEAGFCLHMDDFGTGFSSMSALATLPFTVLKLDKSLVDQIGTDKGDIVIKNIMRTAHELGMHVVAEGVEEAPQVIFLGKLKCDLIQGYYYSAPKKTVLFEELMALEEPFADKKPLEADLEDGVVRIMSSDLPDYLRVCRKMFSVVRFVEAEACRFRMIGENGKPGVEKVPCYQIWQRQERCPDCISLKALQTKKTEHKFEVFEDEAYIVYSVYVEVDGKPCVIEMLNPVGRDILHGCPDNLCLLEAVRGKKEKKTV